MTPESILIVAGSGLLLIGLVGGGIKSKWMDVGSVSGNARVLCGLLGIVFVIAGVWLKLGAPMFSSKPTSAATEPSTAGSSPSQETIANSKAQPNQTGAPAQDPATANRVRQPAVTSARLMPGSASTTTSIVDKIIASYEIPFDVTLNLGVCQTGIVVQDSTTVEIDGKVLATLDVHDPSPVLGLHAHTQTAHLGAGTPGVHNYKLATKETREIFIGDILDPAREKKKILASVDVSGQGTVDIRQGDKFVIVCKPEMQLKKVVE